VGDTVYVGACSGILFAVNRANGTLLWKYDIAADGDAREFHGNPVATKDRVFIPTDGRTIGHIYAFSRSTGEVIWKYSDKAKDDSGFTSDVILDGDRIIGVSVGERLVALSAATGAEQWSYPIAGKKRRVGISAALSDGRLFFGSSNGTVYAIDSRRGTLLWKRELDAPTSTAVVISGDALIVGTEGKTLYQLRASDGELLKTMSLDVVPQDTPATSYRGIYVPSETTVMLVSPEMDRVLWRADSKSKWTSPRPRLWRNLVIVGDRDGTVYGLNEATGAIEWLQNVHDKPIRGIGSDNSTLYVGTLDGIVIALR
jgi:outer membrane protein assembly factor BamB